MERDIEIFIQLWLSLSLIIVSIWTMFESEIKPYQMCFGVFGFMSGAGGILYVISNLPV